MIEQPKAEDVQLLLDLQTDLQEMREDLGVTEIRLSDRLSALQDRLERLQRTVGDQIYAVEDRVRRLEYRQ